MNPVRTRSDGAAILYDADLLDHVDAAFFEPHTWRSRGALAAVARGRGAAWFVRHDGRDLVLRHYRRGGLLGPWLGDRYLWFGLARTRAFREWHLLAELHRHGLPVPRPVAACVRRFGLCYRADLMTERLPDVESLAQRLAEDALPPARWNDIGRGLRRFHDAGVYHADLNAHNVLLGRETLYLVDFDRGRLRAGGRWTRANLARLKRSLDKLKGLDARFCFSGTDWSALLAGYGDGGSGRARGRGSAPQYRNV